MYKSFIPNEPLFSAFEETLMSDWKTRTHEIVFDEPMRQTVNAYAAEREPDCEVLLENLSADGRGIRVRFSDYLDAYTFTISLPPKSGRWSKHSFWFAYAAIPKGLLIAQWIYEQIVSDEIQHYLPDSSRVDW